MKLVYMCESLVKRYMEKFISGSGNHKMTEKLHVKGNVACVYTMLAYRRSESTKLHVFLNFALDG
jgi:hypothetical protein